uniref:Testis development protein prtd n=1 Tax=Ascaris lumbricoides TaxID=6252 RepID=A0A0M3IWX4_ASCLU
MEHASVSTLEHSERSSGEVKKISDMRMDSLMSGTDMRPEDDIPSNLLLQSDYAQMGAVKAMAAEGDEAEQIGEPGESSAARFYFRKDTRESSVSVQERERRSTGFWGISRENERADAVMLDTTNPDVMGLEKSTNCTFLSYLRCTFPKVANFWQQNDSIAKHEVFR